MKKKTLIINNDIFITSDMILRTKITILSNYKNFMSRVAKEMDR